MSTRPRSTHTRALLIGGSGPLGREIGKRLILHHQAQTIIHGGRNKQQFHQTIAHLKRIHPTAVHGIWTPIRDHRAFYRNITAQFPVDILIILYGPYLQQTIASTAYRHWQHMANSNFVLPAALLSQTAVHFQHAPYGRVIGFASDYRTHMTGYKQIAAYAAAKWAFASAIQSAAQQNTNPHIGYYLIAPRHIDYRDSRDSPPAHTDAHSINDVAGGVMTLLDPNTRFKSGCTIKLDTLRTTI